MSLDPRTTIIGRSSQSKSGDSAYDLKQLQQNFTSLQAEKLDATREMKRLQQSLSELDAKYQLSCEQVKIIAQKSKESNHSHVSSLDQLMKIMEERSSAFKMQEDAWKRAETEKVAIIKGLEEKLRSNAGGPRLSTSTGEVVVLREKVLLLEVKLAEVYSRKSISETGKDLEMSKVKQQLAEILSRNQELEQQRDVIKHASESQHVVIENLEKKLLNAETFSKDAVKTIKMLETKVSTLSAGQESIDSLKQKLFSAETSLAISSAKLQDAESQKRQVMAMLKQNMELLEGNRQSSLKVLTGLKAKVEELTEANQALLAGQARPNVDSQALSSKILLIEEKLAKADMENIALQQNIEVLKAKLQSSDERQQRMTEEMKLREDSAKAQDHSITEKFSTEIQELRQKELHFVSETKKLILQLTELQTEKDTYALQVIELQTKIVEIEKFEKAVIEKNLDFQEQITELEIKHKNTLDEKSKEQEAVVLRLTKEISKLEQVVEKNSETDKSRAEVVSRLKEAVTRLEGVVEKLEVKKYLILERKDSVDGKYYYFEEGKGHFTR